jgi:hypothetical protein
MASGDAGLPKPKGKADLGQRDDGGEAAAQQAEYGGLGEDAQAAAGAAVV